MERAALRFVSSSQFPSPILEISTDISSDINLILEVNAIEQIFRDTEKEMFYDFKHCFNHEFLEVSRVF